MQNVGQCRNGDDEHKRISFAVLITITYSLVKKKDRPCRCKSTMAFAVALEYSAHALIECRRNIKLQKKISLSVRALKETKKQEATAKIKGRALHLPNSHSSSGTVCAREVIS